MRRHTGVAAIASLFLAGASAKAQVPASPPAPTKELAPLPLEDLPSLDVASALRDRPATIYVITDEDILRWGLRDLVDVLRMVPGVEWSFTHLELQGGLRGFPTNFSNTLLMINGREVQNLIAGEPFISYQFQMHNVLRVEVVMGPASALYGANAFVGIINIITKRNDPKLTDGGYVQQAVGSWSTFSTGLLYQNVFAPDTSVYGAINYFHSDNEDLGGWLSENSDIYRPRSRAWTRPGDNPKFAYRNEARSVLTEAELEIRGFYAGVLFIHNYSEGGIQEARPAFGERTLRREQFLWYVGFERALTSRLNAKLELGHLTENDIDVWTWAYPPGTTHPIPPESPTNPQGMGGQSGFYGVDAAKKYRLDAELELQLHPSNLLTAGLVLERWDLGTGQLCCTGLTLLPTGNPDLMLVPSERLRKFWKGGVFVQDTHSLWNRVHLTAGVRLDAHSNFDLIVNPRVGLIVDPWTGASLRLLYGHAYREPRSFELETVPDLRASRVRTYELAYDQTAGPLFSSTSLFLNDVKAAILTNPATFRASGTGTVAFIQRDARSYGLEQMLQLRTRRWRAFAAYAFVDRERYEDPVNGVASDALEISRHKLLVAVSVEPYGRTFLSLRNVWNSRVEDVVLAHDGAHLEIETVPAYDNLSATLGIRGLELDELTLEASLILDNLLDRDNLKPNLRGIDPRAYIQNHFSVTALLRAAF